MNVCKLGLLIAMLLSGGMAIAQGTVNDYNRAYALREKFSANKVFYSNVTPQWIEGTHQFWYVRNTPEGRIYVSVNADDPQNGNMGTDTGASVDVTALLSAGNVAESGETTFGIDVARYQGTIDWSQVAASGVQFAMIRVGYRTQKTGEIVADTNAKYNMQEAQANGIKIGAYFFSTAVTTDEAVQEADWVADYISQYQITYPVAFNCEGFENADSRQRQNLGQMV